MRCRFLSSSDVCVVYTFIHVDQSYHASNGQTYMASAALVRELDPVDAPIYMYMLYILLHTTLL